MLVLKFLAAEVAAAGSRRAASMLETAPEQGRHRANALVLTGHDDIDEAHMELHYPGRSPWI